MPVRRKLNNASDKVWKKKILTCLKTGAGGSDSGWGCLNKQNELFRISTLDKIKIPAHVVRKLVDKGKIALDEQSGYYKYVPPEKRKFKRRKLK